ncbi:MAG TPA: hypothetical protein VIR16_12195 [Candidatus Limnocylindrales bacterium]
MRVVLVSEAAPADAANGYEGGDEAVFAQTTVLAFQAAGFPTRDLDDVRRLGVHLTSAVKCPKTAYSVAPATIRACSLLLERELALFPNATALLLMGDVAIRAVNEIARRSREPRPVPAVPTYRLRGGEFRFRGQRVFPSYLQAGPAFFIERGKQRVIAEDIRAALAYAGSTPSCRGERTAPARQRLPE